MKSTCWESPPHHKILPLLLLQLSLDPPLPVNRSPLCVETNTQQPLILHRKHLSQRGIRVSLCPNRYVKRCCSLSHDIRSTDRLYTPPTPPRRRLILPASTSCLQMWQNRKYFKVPPFRPTAHPDANCKCPGHSAWKILTPHPHPTNTTF